MTTKYMSSLVRTKKLHFLQNKMFHRSFVQCLLLLPALKIVSIFKNASETSPVFYTPFCYFLHQCILESQNHHSDNFQNDNTVDCKFGGFVN